MMSRHKKKVVVERPESIMSHKPIWRFDELDRDGKFRFDLSRKDFNHKEVLQKLLYYGNMTWDEIERQQHDNGKSKHHFLSTASLSSDAEHCVKAKNLN